MREEGAKGHVPRRPLDRRWLACALCLAVIALSALAGALQHRANDARQRARFDQLANTATATLHSQLAAFEHGLRGARGAVIAAGPELDRERFQAYSASRDYAREFPGIRGYGYIQRVAPAEEARFVQMAREDGMPHFAIRTLAPHAGERFVIRYLEPMTNNEAAIGLDIASEAARREAALASARSGQATLSRPITLVQEAGSARHGFLLLLPVYRDGAPADTDDARWQATRGWAYAALNIDAVLERPEHTDRLYDLALSDAGEDARHGPFYASADFSSPGVRSLATERAIRIHGRDWRAHYVARPAFVQGLGLPSPLLVAMATAGLGLLSVAVWYLVATSRERRRAAFLDHVRLAALVTGSTETIIA